jgi:amino-acid N-acetyltransferase
MPEPTPEPVPASSLAGLAALLRAAGLPADDLAERDPTTFLISGPAAAPLGGIGLEACGDAGLLRSLVVAPSALGSGLGRRLVEALVAEAVRRRLGRLYLLTETAEVFFHRLGWVVVDRASVPEAVRATREFSALCPDSATCMMRRLDGPAA